MPVFWVLGILALVAVLLLRTRLGILIAVKGRDFTVTVRAGFLRLRVFPRRERRDGQAARRTRKKPEKAKEAEKPPPPRRPAVTQIFRAVRTMPPLLWRMLKRVLRGTRIDPLEFYVSFGGSEDPAQAAGLCGYALTAVWTVMPRLERVLSIPDPYLDFEADFEAAETYIEGEAGVSVRLGTVLLALLPVAVGLVSVFRDGEKRETRREGRGSVRVKPGSADGV